MMAASHVLLLIADVLAEPHLSLLFGVFYTHKCQLVPNVSKWADRNHTA